MTHKVIWSKYIIYIMTLDLHLHALTERMYEEKKV
jgi:hypothetical protein